MSSITYWMREYIMSSIKHKWKQMEKRQSDKYLGDIVSNDGKNIKDIEAKVSRGMGNIS